MNHSSFSGEVRVGDEIKTERVHRFSDKILSIWGSHPLVEPGEGKWHYSSSVLRDQFWQFSEEQTWNPCVCKVCSQLIELFLQRSAPELFLFEGFGTTSGSSGAT